VIKGVNHGHDDSISEDVIKDVNHGHDDSISEDVVTPFITSSLILSSCP
jgi:hypothetical protein